MANKTTLTSAINGFITAVVSVTKVRNAFLELINTFFSTTTTHSNIAGANQYTYNLKFNKRGNKVLVTGFIRNDYATAKSGEVIFTNPTAELYCKTSNDVLYFGQLDPSNANCLVTFNLQNIYLIGVIPSGAALVINTNYLTND